MKYRDNPVQLAILRLYLLKSRLPFTVNWLTNRIRVPVKLISVISQTDRLNGGRLIQQALKVLIQMNEKLLVSIWLRVAALKTMSSWLVTHLNNTYGMYYQFHTIDLSLLTKIAIIHHPCWIWRRWRHRDAHNSGCHYPYQNHTKIIIYSNYSNAKNSVVLKKE